MNETMDIIDKKALLRLHVVANSNSPHDQYIKRIVRDKVIKYFEDNLETLESDLKGELNKIDGFVAGILKSEGADYGVEIELGQYYFPGRTYANLTLQQGKYKALRIALGSGEGSNWWCVLLPPLCIENKEGEKMDDEKIIFKSKLIEWIQGKWGSRGLPEEIIFSNNIEFTGIREEKKDELLKSFRLIDDNILKLKILSSNTITSE